MAIEGTPRALVPLARQVLGWLHTDAARDVDAAERRRIELCAKAVIEWGMFLELYGLADE